MAANISSTFRIIVDETLQGGSGAVSATVTNPGRPFRVVGVYVTGTNGAQLVLNKNNAAGANVAGGTTLATGDLNDFPISLLGIPAALTFTSTDNLFLREDAGSIVTRVIVECEAASPQALTVT